MFQKHKWPTFEGILMIIIMIISVFSFAFFTSDKTGTSQITGEMVRVTGMEGR